jgi:hypothetical protein
LWAKGWERVGPFWALGPDVPPRGGLVAAFRYENDCKLGCNVRRRFNHKVSARCLSCLNLSAVTEMIGPEADSASDLCLGWVLSPSDITVKGRMGCMGWLFLRGLQ